MIVTHCSRLKNDLMILTLVAAGTQLLYISHGFMADLVSPPNVHLQRENLTKHILTRCSWSVNQGLSFQVATASTYSFMETETKILLRHINSLNVSILGLWAFGTKKSPNTSGADKLLAKRQNHLQFESVFMEHRLFLKFSLGTIPWHPLVMTFFTSYHTAVGVIMRITPVWYSSSTLG